MDGWSSIWCDANLVGKLLHSLGAGGSEYGDLPHCAHLRHNGPDVTAEALVFNVFVRLMQDYERASVQRLRRLIVRRLEEWTGCCHNDVVALKELLVLARLRATNIGGRRKPFRRIPLTDPLDLLCALSRGHHQQPDRSIASLQFFLVTNVDDHGQDVRHCLATSCLCDANYISALQRYRPDLPSDRGKHISSTKECCNSDGQCTSSKLLKRPGTGQSSLSPSTISMLLSARCCSACG